MKNNSISIIIATYNAESVLERSIKCVESQLSNSCELIIIDGGSNDCTLSIIDKHKSNISYFSSEPDKGIYDAWNKGILNARNEWIMFIGADDQLRIDTIELYQKFIFDHNNDNFDLISSQRRQFALDGRTIRIAGNQWKWPLCKKGMFITHPGALHNKRIFEKYGLYDIKYKIAGDYELLLRAKNELKTAFIPFITIDVSEGGVSDSFGAIIEQYNAVRGNEISLNVILTILVTTSKFFIKKFFKKIGINIHIKGNNEIA